MDFTSKTLPTRTFCCSSSVTPTAVFILVFSIFKSALEGVPAACWFSAFFWTCAVSDGIPVDILRDLKKGEAALTGADVQVCNFVFARDLSIEERIERILKRIWKKRTLKRKKILLCIGRSYIVSSRLSNVPGKCWHHHYEGCADARKRQVTCLHSHR